MKRGKNDLGTFTRLTSPELRRQERIKIESQKENNNDMIMKTGKVESHECCEHCNKNWIVDDVKVFYMEDSDGDSINLCTKCAIKGNDELTQKQIEEVLEMIKGGN